MRQILFRHRIPLHLALVTRLRHIAAACLLEPPHPAETEKDPGSDTRGGAQHHVFKFPVEFIAIGRRESLLPTGQYEMELGARAESEHPDRGPLTKMRRRA
jgi:hypothetical protein